MVSQDDFPEVWACESDKKTVKVEVRVPYQVDTGEDPEDIDIDLGVLDVENERGGVETRYAWIEVPTTSVETWLDEGEASRVQRTAKVKCPSEWGQDNSEVLHNSPRRLLRSFEGTENRPFMHARVWMKDEHVSATPTVDEQWVLTHHGWIGGVGPASEDGQHKFWIYDWSELLSSAPIDVSFDDPNSSQALETIVELTNENTPIPLNPNGGRQWTPPSGPDVAEAQEAGMLEDPPQRTRLGFQAVGLGPIEEVGGVEGPDQSGVLGYVQDGLSLGVDGEVNVQNRGSVTDAGPQVAEQTLGSKTFRSNHETLLDVYEWWESKTSAEITFEPITPEDGGGVGLWLSPRTVPRDFVQEDAFDRYAGGSVGAFENDSIVRKNNALFEAKPINTLQVRGETTSASSSGGQVESTVDRAGDLIFGDDSSEESSRQMYPVVTVQVPSLLEAAEGYELSPRALEIDAKELDEAESVAIDEMRKRLREASEGTIILNGEPRLVPGDHVVAFEVCDGDINYEQEPVTYEVLSVKHTKSSDDVMKTEVDVGIAATNEIEVTQSEYVYSTV